MAEGQGQPDMAQVFHNLTLELNSVSNALTAQGISNTVIKFDGNPKNYREWIRSIEKYATLVNVPDPRKKLIAYQSSSGAVSGFIHRYMQANPHNTWAQLKQQLAVRFSDVTDSQTALSMLRSVRQKPGENIQVYAERILSLAEIAYDNQGGDAIERQLIDILVDGLTNDQLKIKILRDEPDTLQGAVAIATNEQNLRMRVSMSHNNWQGPHNRTTPMEVDLSRGHRYRPNNRRVNSTQNKSIKCWACGEVGHISRDCKKEETNRKNMGHGRSRFQSSKTPGNQGN